MIRRGLTTAAGLLLALMGLGATSCSVGDIDLAGRPCPCAAGYRCDQQTNTCVPADAATGGSAGSGGVAGSGGGGGAAAAGGAGGAGGSGEEILLFSDDFNGDLAAWLEHGDGVWSVAAGEAVQNDDTVSLAFIYVPPDGYPDDIRISAAMRQLSGIQGGALEVTFRITTDPERSQYFCNWEPNAGRFLIMASDAGMGTTFVDTFPELPTDYDPFGSFTMQVEVVGNVITCRVDEIPEAVGTVTADDPYFPTGSFGLKTYQMAAAFDYIRVHSIPAR